MIGNRHSAVRDEFSNKKQSQLLFLLPLFCVLTCFHLCAQASEKSPIRVACIGDSITYGHGITDREKNSYPAQLGQWLGLGWDVRNFGVSATTLLEKGDRPYFRQSAYTNALKFTPDVVLILLGTNDSKHRGDGSTNSEKAPENWQHKTDFVPDYEKLIASFQQANPAVRVYVCLPTPCFPGSWGINGKTIHEEIIPLIREIARDSHVHLIDFYSVFADRKDLFPDTVHPNNAGARLMAATVYHALTNQNPPTEKP